MYERRAEEQPAVPPPPVGTVKATRPPADVRVGDFIYLDGKYQRVQDMRSAGTAAHRVLLFAGRPPWTMRRAQDTFRPVAPR